MFIPIENTSPCFKEFTLVMPAVSVGNVRPTLRQTS
uniref:Uncharacterized protein n=1 Tax=Anguilla anguilla TaxID=7936 RepID=A0A0E9V8S0_ANGAN